MTMGLISEMQVTLSLGGAVAQVAGSRGFCRLIQE